MRGGQGLFVELDGVRQIALFGQIDGQPAQDRIADLVRIDALQRITGRQGELLLLDRGDDQVAAGGRGRGVQTIGAGVLPHGLGKIAALLKGAPGGKMGQGLDAVDLGLVAGLAGDEGSGQVVELGDRGGRKQRARGQGKNAAVSSDRRQRACDQPAYMAAFESVS